MTPEEKLKKQMDFKRGMASLALSPVKSEDYVSPLNDSIHRIKGSVDAPEAKTIVKGITDNIDTKSIQKQISRGAFADKIQAILKSRAAAKAGGIAGDMIKKVPMIGGIAAGLGTLLTTGDASAASQAALPLVGDSDDLGPSTDSLEGKIESGTATPDELYRLRNGMK